MLPTVIHLSETWTREEQLGPSGGFGTVFRGKGRGREVALKFVPIKPGADRELRFGEELLGRPHVVQVLDKGVHGGFYVIVMELAERSLADAIAAGDIGLALGRSVALDIATGLSDLRDVITHRDIKPANILSINGVWHLADFGISKFVAEVTGEMEHTRKGYGTPQYVAPELWGGGSASHSSDMYALGMATYEAIEGVLPLDGSVDWQHAHQHGPRRSPSLPEFPDELMMCLQVNSAQRPSAKQLVEALR